ncbi:MAG: hypothetical protein DRI36_06485 [Caldiserica bacterium]|nr:MAG: hypothetical protein DRI36_06485 [Caldisericota bacterium]
MRKILLYTIFIGIPVYLLLFYVQAKFYKDYKKEEITDKIVYGEVSSPYEYGILKDEFPYVNWDYGYMLYSTRIVHVYDGDTVRDNEGRIIRFLGVNAPEIPHPEFREKGEKGGKEAMEYVKNEILYKDVLLIIPEEEARGYYGRVLALIFFKKDGRWRCLNYEMVRKGIAEPYIFKYEGFLKRELWYSVWKKDDKGY